MPSEFARQPRTLLELERWKATEFRQFLLYTGPIVLRNVVKSSIYTHFLMLSIAVSIMLNASDEKRNSLMAYAKQLIDRFIEYCPMLYGSTFTVYNIHNLKHLHEDCVNHQCSLNDISAFPFENYRHQLKKKVKNSRNPIAQVVKRTIEYEQAQSTRKMGPSRFSKMHISSKVKDRCFILNDGCIAIVKEVRSSNEILCDVFNETASVDFYKEPCSSKLLGISFLPSLTHGAKLTRILLRDNSHRKACCLPYKSGHVIMPLLHEVE
jgi:hypothetical protein